MKALPAARAIAASALVIAASCTSAPPPPPTGSPLLVGVSPSPGPSVAADRGRWRAEPRSGPSAAYRTTFVALSWTPELDGPATRPAGAHLDLTVRCAGPSGQRESLQRAPRLGSDNGTELYGLQLNLLREDCRIEPLGVTVSGVGPTFSRDVALAVARTSWPVRRVDAIEAVTTTWSRVAAELGVVGPPNRPRDLSVVVVAIAGELQFPSPHGEPSPWGAWIYDARTGEELLLRASSRDEPPGLPAWFHRLR